MASGQDLDASSVSPLNGISDHEQPLGSELGASGVWGEDYRQSPLQDWPPPATVLLSEPSAHHCSVPMASLPWPTSREVGASPAPAASSLVI